jgi:hypothetical protein
VRVTLGSPGVPPDPAPQGWLQTTSAGNVVSFVDSRFSERRLAEGLASRFKGIKNVEVRSLALRRIFTTLARESREGRAS